MKKENLDFLSTHVLFSLTSIIILMIPILQVGLKLFILVIIYNLLIPVISLYRKHQEWIKIWSFSFLISIFQIFPDWFLSAELNILVFPEDGLFKIGTVSGYMIGLWTIPLFIIILIGTKLQDKKSNLLTYCLVAIISLLIFGISEATMWLLPSWYPQNVTLLFEHLAIYIIIPEIILGVSSYYFFKNYKDNSIYYRLITAFTVMIIYMGYISFFYFLIEKIIFLI
ncbi:MAG: hypothetical protein EU533_00755 [Promethearchaeota archaeon]|nr:MAG: hypothetical protein EU533_00755 [Candidatus Lokiarchaeota archaeon]